MFSYIDNQKQQIIDEIHKLNSAQHVDVVELKKRVHGNEDDIRGTKFIVDQHTQFVREFELKMGIFENH